MTKKKCAEPYMEIAHWKWEFLRHNEDYKKDFSKYCIVDGPINYVHGDIVGHAEDGKARKHFVDEYNIVSPLNPKYSFDELIKINESKPGDVLSMSLLALSSIELTSKEGDTRFSFDAIQDHSANKGKIRIESNGDGEVTLVGSSKNQKREVLDPKTTNFRTIEVTINLDASIGDIKREINVVVAEWKGLYDSCHTEKWRNQYARYSDYIKIYELKKEGKGIREIAKEVFPDDYKKVMKTYRNSYDFDPLKEKINASYKACQDLIKSSYKKIR